MQLPQSSPNLLLGLLHGRWRLMESARMEISKKLIGGLLLIVGLGRGQDMIATPSTSINLHVCAIVVVCDELGVCHDTYIPGVTVVFSVSRYTSSGGHNHIGGPVPV